MTKREIVQSLNLRLTFCQLFSQGRLGLVLSIWLFEIILFGVIARLGATNTAKGEYAHDAADDARTGLVPLKILLKHL